METIETGAIRRILNELVPILEKYTLKFRDYCPLAMGALVHDQHTGPCTPSCFRNDIGYLFDIYDYDNCNSGGVLEEISSRGTSFSLGFSGKHELFKELDNDLSPVVPNDPGNVFALNLAELCNYAEYLNMFKKSGTDKLLQTITLRRSLISSAMLLFMC